MTAHPLFSDEKLMAYADGELPETEATAIRRAAAIDASLAARIRSFQLTGRGLGQVFSAHRDSPVPAQLLELLQAPSLAEHPKLHALPTRKPLRARARHWWPQALAACVLVAMTAVLMRTPVQETNHAVIAGLPINTAEVSRVLDATPSGEIAAIQSGGQHYEVLPTASFQDAAGRYCREFTASDLGTGQDAHALACRGVSQWQIELATNEQRVAVVQDEGYFPAGAGDAQPFADRKPLTAEAERQLIAKGWRP